MCASGWQTSTGYTSDFVHSPLPPPGHPPHHLLMSAEAVTTITTDSFLWLGGAVCDKPRQGGGVYNALPFAGAAGAEASVVKGPLHLRLDMPGVHHACNGAGRHILSLPKMHASQPVAPAKKVRLGVGVEARSTAACSKASRSCFTLKGTSGHKRSCDLAKTASLQDHLLRFHAAGDTTPAGGTSCAISASSTRRDEC